MDLGVNGFELHLDFIRLFLRNHDCMIADHFVVLLKSL